MIEMALYKEKYGGGFKLTKYGEKYVANNWENLTYKELSDITGVGTRSIARFLSRQGFYKRKVKEKEAELIISLLRSYEGKITCSDACSILEKYHNLTFNWHKVNKALKENGFKYLYDSGKTRVFIDGNKNNLREDNIVLLTPKEYEYLCNIDNITNMKNEILLSSIELAKLKVAKNSIQEMYIASNLNTGEVIKARNKSKISLMITRRHSQYEDCKKIGEKGERYIRDWVVTREIKEYKNGSKRS